MRGSPAAKGSGLRGSSHGRHITTMMRTKPYKDMGRQVREVEREWGRR
jgi:hypothetical protein